MTPIDIFHNFAWRIQYMLSRKSLVTNFGSFKCDIDLQTSKVDLNFEVETHFKN